MRRLSWFLLAGLICLPLCTLAALSRDPAPAASTLTHALGDFGPIDTPANAQATYAKALDEVKKRGGVLLVPAPAWRLLKDVPLQGLVRTPPAPAETRQWKSDNGVTVVVVEEQHTTVQVPPLTGLHIDRHLRL